MADLQTAREYIDYQLRRDEEMDGSWLTPDDYKWFMAQLIQLSIAEQLKRIAYLLAELVER